MDKKRPISPHLSIYKFQINTIMSITHRLTGIILFAFFSFLAWGFIIWFLLDFSEKILLLINNIFFKIFFSVSIYSLYYHLFNGIRYLLWSIVLGFSKFSIINYSYLVLLLSLLSTLFTLRIIFVI